MQEVFSFDQLEAAMAARDALVSAGFARDALEVRTIKDEAGPAQGNFVIGNGIAADGSRSRGMLEGAEVPYEENFERTVSRGVYLLQVRVDDAARREEIAEAVKRLGGVDVQARASAA